MGATIHQKRHPGDPWELLGFFSKKLDSTQVSYSTFNREFLATFSAVWHFRFHVEGALSSSGQTTLPSPLL